MLKNTFLTLAILFATSTVAYTQDQEVTRSLSMYICGGSGNINPEANGDASVILGHFGEAGLTYSQNFASVQWLTFSSTFGICTGGGGLAKGKDENGKDVWVKTTDPVGSFTDAYLHVDLAFAGYFNLGLHSQGRLEFDARYPIALSANQKIVVSTAFEIRPMGKLWYDTPSTTVDTGAMDKGQVLGFMKYEFLYSIQFHPEWSYTTDVEFRFHGKGSGEGSGVDNDSMEAVKNSFNIRWNHMISYSNPNGFGGYFNFRYEPTNIIEAGGKGRVDNFKLSAGVSYSYDLSAL